MLLVSCIWGWGWGRKRGQTSRADSGSIDLAVCAEFGAYQSAHTIPSFWRRCSVSIATKLGISKEVYSPQVGERGVGEACMNWLGVQQFEGKPDNTAACAGEYDYHEFTADLPLACYCFFLGFQRFRVLLKGLSWSTLGCGISDARGRYFLKQIKFQV